MNKVLITVIIPVYNGEKYIDNCLKSVFKQTFKDYEIIIINDGSTDKTLDIITKIKNKHSNITILDISNHGQGYARNLALKQAKGKYILFLDSDDTIAEKTLEITFNEIENTNADLVNFSYSYVGTDEVAKLPFFTLNGLLEGDKCSILLSNTFYFSVNNLYSKKFLLDNNIKYGEGYIYEDYEFWLKVSLCAKKVFFSKDFLYFVTKHDSSSTTTNINTDKHMRDYLKAISNCLPIVKDNINNPDLKYFYKYLFNRFFRYYNTRVPKEYQKEFAKEFVDVMYKYPLTKTENKNYDRLINLNIFAKKKYNLFRIFCKLYQLKYKRR